MTRTARIPVALALAAALASVPTTATAEPATVPDPSGDSSRAVDVTRIKVQHGPQRIRAVITIPQLQPRKLSGTELLIKTEGEQKVYAVGVARNRKGKVVDTSLTWRKLNDPVAPTKLSCSTISTALSSRRTVVVVPTSCLSMTRPKQRIKAKIRTVNGFVDPKETYFNDQTEFTRYLAPGASSAGGPEAKVTARGGLVVRSLPTANSARLGKLANGEVYPLTCQVTGSLIYRDNDVNQEASNRWYSLPGQGGEWVSALYLTSVGYEPPYCGDGKRYDGRVRASSVARQEAPTTRSDFHGEVTRGDTVKIRCQMRGQRVQGSNRWYNLDSFGFWVPAQSVAINGATPAFCG